jgi:hypothetical protein
MHVQLTLSVGGGERCGAVGEQRPAGHLSDRKPRGSRKKDRHPHDRTRQSHKFTWKIGPRVANCSTTFFEGKWESASRKIQGALAAARESGVAALYPVDEV